MREIKEIQKIILDLKKWCQEDLGVEYYPELILEQLYQISQVRVNYFLKRRLGHLPDPDFFNVCKLLTEENRIGVLPPPPPQPPAPIKNERTKKSKA